MKIIKPTYEFITPINENTYNTILKRLEIAGRTCYKSENNITEESAEKFVKMLIKRGHEAMIEHCSFTVKFIVDRGVSHELTRHRIASFAQESTRYCNYSNDKFGNELTFIRPFYYYNCVEPNRQIEYNIWKESCQVAEDNYFKLLKNGSKPEEARSILPNSLKTEIVMTMNIREWRHFFKLRCDKAAHPQMREIAIPLLLELQEKMPALFEDIVY